MLKASFSGSGLTGGGERSRGGAAWLTLCPLRPLPRSAPPSALLPVDSEFLPDVPSTVPAWRTGSGHILVQPLIDGQAPGYFILDTGEPLPGGRC